jgi:hypothetical protein
MKPPRCPGRRKNPCGGLYKYVEALEFKLRNISFLPPPHHSRNIYQKVTPSINIVTKTAVL